MTTNLSVFRLKKSSIFQSSYLFFWDIVELVAPVSPFEGVELVAAEGLIAPKKAL